MVNLNNVNVPVHIGSRGIRKGKSSRKLRGIKRNQTVTFKEDSNGFIQDQVIVDRSSQNSSLSNDSSIVSNESPFNSNQDLVSQSSLKPDDGINKIFDL